MDAETKSPARVEIRQRRRCGTVVVLSTAGAPVRETPDYPRKHTGHIVRCVRCRYYYYYCYYYCHCYYYHELTNSSPGTASEST